jgi:membrane fusion protein (multidrug efflux system)
MKFRYLLYALLLMGFTSLVTYRIVKNKEISGGGAGGGRGAGGAGGGGQRGGAEGGKGVAGKGKVGAAAGKGGAPAGGGAPIRVNGIVVKPTEFANTILVSGSIEPNEMVELHSEVSGRVTSLSFQEGTVVRKGQQLLKIDDSELRAQLSQALTAEKLQEENARRADLLLKKEAISQEENDVAQATLQTVRQQSKLIRAQIAKTVILAPFAGKVGLRYIISPTTTIANLVSINPVKITFSIPEKYSGQVKLGTKFTFTVAGRETKYSAAVYAIEPSIEATTRTLQLRARGNNPNNELVPGLFAKIDLPLSVLHNAILIPTEAIIPVLKGKKVFVSRGGTAQEVMVETDTRTDKAILITSGLKAGDTVLTTGTMSLKPDSPVKVTVDK